MARPLGHAFITAVPVDRLAGVQERVAPATVASDCDPDLGCPVRGPRHRVPWLVTIARQGRVATLDSASLGGARIRECERG